MQKQRLFIGLPASSSLQKRLRRERKNWEHLPLFLIPEENLHVTLLFLGMMDEECIDEISLSIEEALEGVSSFEIEFTHINLAPSQEKPSMVWLSGEVSEELRDLREKLKQSLEYIFSPSKSFRPHINLARLRRKEFHALSQEPVFEKSFSLIESVETVILYESVTEGGKRRYEPIREFSLN